MERFFDLSLSLAAANNNVSVSVQKLHVRVFPRGPVRIMSYTLIDPVLQKKTQTKTKLAIFTCKLAG